MAASVNDTISVSEFNLVQIGAQRVHYAVEVQTDVAWYTNSALGIVSGIMRYITDQSTGTLYYEDMSVNTDTWFEGFITEDGLSKPSRQVDLSGTGDYGTLSGFNFTIDNTIVAGSDTPLWETLKDNEVWLTNRRVIVYAVIENVFYKIWSGIISNNPYNETDYKFVCKDDFQKIHKPIPPVVITKNNYPNSVEESKDKAIPISIGDVVYAGLVNVNGFPNAKQLYGEGSEYYYNVAAVEYNFPGQGSGYIITDAGEYSRGGTTIPGVPYLYILSGRFSPLGTITYIEDDPELVNNYLFVNSGGGSPDTEKGIRILANEASTTVTPIGWTGSVAVTKIWLSEPLDVSTSDFNSNYNYFSGDSAPRLSFDVWYFSVYMLKIDLLLSNNEIKSFKRDSNNDVQLFEYTNDKIYRSVKNITANVETADPNYDNAASVSVLSNNITKDGEIKYTFPVSFEYEPGSLTLAPFSAESSGAIENIFDKDRSANYEIIWTPGSYSGQLPVFGFLINLDYNDDLSNVENIYAAFDFNWDGTLGGTFLFNINFFDMYRSLCETQTLSYPDTTKFIQPATTPTVNLLPNEYYSNGNDNNEISLYGTYFNAGSAPFSSVKSLIEISNSNSVIDRMKSGLIRDQIYVLFKFWPTTSETKTFTIKQFGLVGVRSIDVIGNNLYARVSGEQINNNDTNTVYNAYRLMLEGYDGISAANIDYDNLPDVRHNKASYKWFVGRQLLEQKNSFEYIKELAQDSFTAVVPTRNGKRKITAWRDRTDAPHGTHDETVIIRDSITNYTKSKVQDVYNNFTIKYGYSPGPDGFLAQYQIKEVDQETIPTGEQFPTLWDICHMSYDIYAVQKELKRELKWYNDRSQWYNSGEGGDGLGTDDSSYNFLENAVYYMTRQKDRVEYMLPMNTHNVHIELGDPITFNDPIYTNGADRSGWVELIEYDLSQDAIKLKVILEPFDTIDDDYGDIIETGDAPDTITESGSQADTITEDG